MVCLDEQQTGKLSVGPSGRLESHGVHAGDLPQQLSRFVEHLQTSLHRLLRLKGVNLGKPGQGCHIFVNFGIVFHGAGAQGIESVVDPVDPLGQRRVVAGQLRLRHMGQAEEIRPGVGQRDLRHIAGGQQGQVLARRPLFKNQLHVSTPPSQSPPRGQALPCLPPRSRTRECRPEPEGHPGCRGLPEP